MIGDKFVKFISPEGKAFVEDKITVSGVTQEEWKNYFSSRNTDGYEIWFDADFKGKAPDLSPSGVKKFLESKNKLSANDVA